MKKIFFIWALLLSIATYAQEPFKGFIQISKDRDLYVDYVPAEAGKPVLVLLNGLTYDTKSWDLLMPYILGKGFGVLRYDPYGMGETLIKNGAPKQILQIEQQASDLRLLLDALKIKKANLLGLSYGGGLAMKFAMMFPDSTDKIILMAPYVHPLASQDQWIKTQINITRTLYPLNPLTYDQLYDYFLKIHIFLTYPLAEPLTANNPLKLDAIHKMVAGIRKFNALAEIHKIPPQSVHLMVASMDQYIPHSDHRNLWHSLSDKQKISNINILGSEHKIPESVASFAGAWVTEIMNKNPEIKKAREFVGNPFLRLATCGSLILKIGR